jgi:hypothetical protein
MTGDLFDAQMGEILRARQQGGGHQQREPAAERHRRGEAEAIPGPPALPGAPRSRLARGEKKQHSSILARAHRQ